MKSLSRIRLFATPWTVAYQAPPSMGFSRQECWSGLPFPSPGDLPDPGIEPGSPTLQADALLSEPPGKQSTFKVKPCPQRGARASGLTLSGRGNWCLSEYGTTHESSSLVSMFNWPPPEVRREGRDFFPDKAGVQPSCGDKEARRGSD